MGGGCGGWTAALALVLVTAAATVFGDDREVLGYTETVWLDRQGPLKGLIVTVGGEHRLDRVKVYLGVPYAESQERFMPPGESPTWCPKSEDESGSFDRSHCRPLKAEYLRPVCPQQQPEMLMANTNKRLSIIRQNYLKRLTPLLGNQSEDCLYLNIYAPHDPKNDMNDREENGYKPTKKTKYAVIMFIHGESFEWNSGNPYDGSVLASYGKVIFITINYRVGVLGFLKSNGGDIPASNFGLLDQMAALEWIKNNIHAFGGNPNAVTVMGHGTGAACANFLMMSPPVNNNNLFQRAILMSGSALSDWALVKNPILNTIQVGQSLNCGTGGNEKFFDCLRRKRFTDLVSTKMYMPPFVTVFGPMIDGVMITNEPLPLLKEHKNLMNNYNILAGVTEYESYHLLDSISLMHGMLENEQHKVLLDYMKAKFEIFPELTRTATLAQYTDHGDRTWSSSGALENRDVLLDILSDAMVLAPLIQLSDIQSEVNENTFFYVFTHRSIFSEYDVVKKSINGEDLPYVLGVPLGGKTIHYKTQYDQKEKRLSEMIMTHWSNFAKTGDPNFSRKFYHNEWKTNNVRWPKYNSVNRAYMELNLTNRPKINYRTGKCKFWNEDLPQRIEHQRQKDAEQSKPSYPSMSETDRDPPPPWIDPEPIFSLPTLVPGVSMERPSNTELNPGEKSSDVPSDNQSSPERVEASSSVVVSLVIIIGILFLLVNICAFGGIYYQRDKLRVRERLFNNRFRCNGGNASRTFDDDDDDDREVYTKTEDAEMANAHKFNKNPQYDSVVLASVKPEAMGGKRLGKWAEMSRQRSSSTVTMDPHTRVKEWINTEIIQRYSPRILRRQRREEKKRQLVCVEDPVMMADQSVTTANARAAEKTRDKVSVAIDATPAARTISVLKQTPIELTKSMDQMGRSERVEIKQSLSLGSINRKTLARSDALNESDDLLSSQDTLHKSSTSIQLKPATKEKRPGIKVTHGYSKSEPVQDISKEPLYSQVCKPKMLATSSKNTSFESSSHYEDINVTSKEYAGSDGGGGVGDCCSDGGSSIHRIKYPKVLPDFPTHCNTSYVSEKRLSLPPPMAGIPEGSSTKIPPPPPPRISSTLGRKKDSTKTHAMMTMQAFNKPLQSDTIPEEHKSLVVPCVPNKVCPAVSTASSPIKRPVEPRIVIKATSVQHQLSPLQNQQHHQNQHQKQQSKRTNIPRVVHPQNADRNKIVAGTESDTGTIKRKKK